MTSTFSAARKIIVVTCSTIDFIIPQIGFSYLCTDTPPCPSFSALPSLNALIGFDSCQNNRQCYEVDCSDVFDFAGTWDDVKAHLAP
jgi:hypothetical protein